MTTKVIIRNILTFSLALMAGAPCAYADLLDDGRQAFMDYDFEKAAELYDKYAKVLKENPMLTARGCSKNIDVNLKLPRILSTMFRKWRL